MKMVSKFKTSALFEFLFPGVCSFSFLVFTSDLFPLVFSSSDDHSYHLLLCARHFVTVYTHYS